MSKVLKRLADAGLTLPEPLKMPPGVVLPFPWVHVRGERILVSGHGPQEPDGSLSGPFGQVGAEVDPDTAKVLARKTALAMLGSLHRELGDLDRIAGWVRVFGMVNSAPGFAQQPAVINGFSEMILDLFGQDAGRHARSAVGMAGLPFNLAVEIEAELVLADPAR
ncbi:RidA family protein [Marinibaculum pumilum]|uniref:RidA family protein n=1 Tax=Marinibaculum pumilum TaxID=1766165 RepID=A0ABV7L7H2_9PROT